MMTLPPLKTLLAEPSWQQALKKEFTKPYMVKLQDFLAAEYRANKIIYPSQQNIFKAFSETPLNKVKVVIIGQDPYHGVGQANGLCFSVGNGVRLPPSLVNIYKELYADCKIKPATHGCLKAWCQQGVFLLNSVLTVEKGQAASHQGKGWEQFTDEVIRILNQQERPIVFVLWGSYAQKKGSIIDSKQHKIIKSTHPSPLSAYRGFLGSKPFSEINTFLIKTNQTPINWQLLEKTESKSIHIAE